MKHTRRKILCGLAALSPLLWANRLNAQPTLIVNDVRTILVPDDMKALLMGAIYAVAQEMPYDSYEMGITHQSATSNLEEYWGVVDASTVNSEALDWLFVSGHRVFYEKVAPMVSALKNAADIQQQKQDDIRTLSKLNGADRYINFYTRWLKRMSDGSLDYLPRPLPDSILAWDMARVVWVDRFAVTAQYISEGKARIDAVRALRIVQQNYQSWEDFGASFLTGRLFWMTGDFEENQTELSAYLKAYKILLNQPASPWKKYPLH